MTINRNNYETYFLLYVDNELCAAERKAVDDFIAENTDLKNELEILLATTLPVDDISFPFGHSLLKKEALEDSLREKLLLHLDNELDETAVRLLENELQKNTSIQSEWNILKQTKLDPANQVVFEDKRSLYRKEKRTVVYMRFMRAAVAAAVIAALMYAGISFFSNDKAIENVAVNNGSQQQRINDQTIPVTPDEVNTAELPVQKNSSDAGNEPVAAANLRGKTSTINKATTSNTAAVKSSTGFDNKEQAVNNNTNIAGKELPKKETNNLPKPYFENINNQKSNEAIASDVQDKTKKSQNNNLVTDDKLVLAKNNSTTTIVPLSDTEITEMKNSYAMQAVSIPSENESSNNHILFMNEEKVNRTKISGLFRKVKRVISRNTNVKTGGSITIAGFEFAAR